MAIITYGVWGFIGTVICYVLSIGWLLANFQYLAPTLADDEYRNDLGMCCLISLVVVLMPPLVIAVYFVTGFAERGWRLKRLPKSTS